MEQNLSLSNEELLHLVDKAQPYSTLVLHFSSYGTPSLQNAPHNQWAMDELGRYRSQR